MSARAFPRHPTSSPKQWHRYRGLPSSPNQWHSVALLQRPPLVIRVSNTATEASPRHPTRGTATCSQLRGFEITGGLAIFSGARLVDGILDNRTHAAVAYAMRDSALGVLEHRRAAGLPLG